MNALIEAAVEHARTVLMVLLLLLITGTLTYINIPKEADPEVNIPFVIVKVPHDGISPEDADRMLIQPMYSELESVTGLKKLETVGLEGSAHFYLEFDAGFDADDAISDVREAVDRGKGNLPMDADEPTVDEINTANFPQLVIGLGGALPERTLYNIADRLKDAIEAIPGVLEVRIEGKREEMVEIVIDPLVMESYNITERDLVNAVSRNNTLIAAGVLDSGVGRVALKVPGVIENAEDLFNLPIKAIDGRVVRLRDIADVRRLYKDATSFARVNGKRSVTMEIVKRSGANVINTIDATKAVIDQSRPLWPQGLEVSYFGDRSVDIRDMLRDLQNNVLSAVLLVVVVVIAALGVRSAGLVAIAIPGSFVIGMLVIDMLGMTVNIVVLFSLIMAVGMLVDGAIVVTEFADRRMINGDPRRLAYKSAAQRMAWPIIASTATTLAAFMPLVFWPGVMGEFMKYLPITLIATLSASLAMALIFVPTLGGLIGTTRPLSPAATRNMNLADSGDIRQMSGATGVYVRFLSWAIMYPFSVLVFVIAVMLGVVTAYGKFGNGTEFFPEVEPEQAIASVIARGDLAVRERDAILRKVEERAMQLPEVRTAYARTVVDDTDQIGSVNLEFTDWDKRSRRVDEVLDDLRLLQDEYPGLHIELQKQAAGPGGDQKPIQLAFSSPDAALTRRTVERARDWMTAHGGFTDIETTLPLPGAEWAVKVDREEAGRYGADISLVGTFVQLVTNGVRLSSYRPDDSDDELDIRVRFPAEQRQLAQLDQLRLSANGSYVPLGNFATVEPAPKVSSITRLDGQRIYRLKAAPKALDGETVVNTGQLANERLSMLHEMLESDEAAREFEFDPSVTVTFEGQDQDQQESQAFLMNAMGIALFVMAIILVTQFNSFYQAALVLAAVVLSVGGVFLGLLITGEAFGIIMGGVGTISLAGIVVNNNIVLIDTYNVLKRDGMDGIEAVLRTGAQRLRPVLLTTITTILGLLPMVLKVNIDLFGREISFGAPSTQWWSQLATSVAGGMTFATVLTLVLTPCLLAWPELRNRAKAARDGKAWQEEAPSAATS